IDAFMPQSRVSPNRSAHMLRSIAHLTRANEARFEATETVSQLDNVIGGKFNAVNVSTWSRGTIEFRQHPATLSSGKVMNWVSLLIGLIEDSDANRIDYAPSATREVTETVASPVQPYRRNSNIGLLWSACRISGGASVRQLVNITGMTPQNIRARFSEMRSAHGDDVIVMHTQQSYNNHYGSSNGQYDLGGYEVLEHVERTTSQASSGVCLMSDDILGSTDIYAGASHSIARYFQSGVVTQTRL
ncbi:amidoligase family protein, partial [Roseivirga sp.]|nr:amidoligase family protein [Roseivirga sp.]MDB4448253.1 amidoligase family protein [Roseivirga sp.]